MKKQPHQSIGRSALRDWLGADSPARSWPALLAAALLGACVEPVPATEVAPPASSVQVLEVASAVARSAPSVASVRCGPIPNTSYRIERVITQSSPPDPSYPWQKRDAVSIAPVAFADLDGDGTADMLAPAPEPGDCNHDAHYELYLVRAGCGEYVGTFVGMPAVPTTPTSAGGSALPELTTTVDFGAQDDPRNPAVLRTVNRTYRFDGTKYQETARAESSVTCHHCSNLSCNAAPMSAP